MSLADEFERLAKASTPGEIAILSPEKHTKRGTVVKLDGRVSVAAISGGMGTIAYVLASNHGGGTFPYADAQFITLALNNRDTILAALREYEERRKT